MSDEDGGEETEITVLDSTDCDNKVDCSSSFVPLWDLGGGNGRSNDAYNFNRPKSRSRSARLR